MWTPGDFFIATADGPLARRGYVYRGLGLFRMTVETRRAPVWSLTHLNSGHMVAKIRGSVRAAFPVASEIADCSDWGFSGLHGWKNQEPELPQKLSNILARHPKAFKPAGNGNSDPHVASQISRLRFN